MAEPLKQAGDLADRRGDFGVDGIAERRLVGEGDAQAAGIAADLLPRSGPSGLRARVGFMPNTPEAEAGIRIEPPPSLACATGRMRAATAAPAPPDEPPEE